MLGERNATKPGAAFQSKRNNWQPCLAFLLVILLLLLLFAAREQSVRGCWMRGGKRELEKQRGLEQHWSKRPLHMLVWIKEKKQEGARIRLGRGREAEVETQILPTLCCSHLPDNYEDRERGCSLPSPTDCCTAVLEASLWGGGQCIKTDWEIAYLHAHSSDVGGEPTTVWTLRFLALNRTTMNNNPSKLQRENRRICHVLCGRIWTIKPTLHGRFYSTVGKTEQRLTGWDWHPCNAPPKKTPPRLM